MTSIARTTVKLLLVDDLDNNLLSLAALLRREGVELLLARSGAEALELLLIHPVALALIDVQMPEMDGFELAELMRGSERTRHVPIIFVTAGASDERRVFKGYESGAVDFLYKPIDPHILRSKVGVFIELEQQKLALAHELREKTETLRLNEMFTAMLGHDLRGPLSAIVMGAILLERKAPDETTRKSAKRMLESAKRMSRMIVEMLDLARTRLGAGIPIRRQRIDFHALVEKTIEEQRMASPDRSVELQSDGNLEGEWDADRCAQLASNLIGNAIQHGDSNAPVECALDGGSRDEIVFTVSNAGSIPPQILPHLFNPFRSRDDYPAQRNGLGLGLYIVEQIARAHGGQVEVASGPDNRTMLRVNLPRA